jgi:hypothetical protein
MGELFHELIFCRVPVRALANAGNDHAVCRCNRLKLAIH